MKLYRANVRLVATAYIKAESEEQAKELLLIEVGDGTTAHYGADDFRDLVEDDQFQAPELSGFSFSPAITFYGMTGEGVELAEDDVPAPVAQKLFSVCVTRRVAEDAIVTVWAADEAAAKEKAIAAAVEVEQSDWDCYDCTYDVADAEQVKEVVI